MVNVTNKLLSGMQISATTLILAHEYSHIISRDTIASRKQESVDKKGILKNQTRKEFDADLFALFLAEDARISSSEIAFTGIDFFFTCQDIVGRILKNNNKCNESFENVFESHPSPVDRREALRELKPDSDKQLAYFLQQAAEIIYSSSSSMFDKVDTRLSV